ncbi:MAG: homoserine dehydrogenase [Alphaproteobacteria bacterium]|jgi:homoserine dehydrogenase|nr:homoserine dehydrogenase [Alphaproteobacteria bacterium]
MYLHSKLEDHKENINIALIGCGKFISMFLSQYNQLKKIKIDSIVDKDVRKAKSNCINSGLSKETIEQINFVNSLDDILNRNIEIFIEATGNPIMGTQHASKVIQSKKNIIMVNVEADVLCGKYLSDLAKEHDVNYSMAYGDQPSLILEQIEWARLNGFYVTCAGKGTKYHSSFEYSTPENVWDNYGLTHEKARKAGMNPKMFNSFVTGDKSSIEMAAVANASGLKCPDNGLTYPPVGVYDIANKLIPKNRGGVIDHEGQVEVISSIDKNKIQIPNDLRWGVYIVIKAQNNYAKNCFKEYGMITDKSGYYSAIWRPYHYIGLELAQSIYSIALDKKSTGHTKFFNADVISVAKKDLSVGERLDGEGGFAARGKLVSSKNSVENNFLPLGLSDGAITQKIIKKDEFIKINDVTINWNQETLKARKYQMNLMKK